MMNFFPVPARLNGVHRLAITRDGGRGHAPALPSFAARNARTVDRLDQPIPQSTQLVTATRALLRWTGRGTDDPEAWRG